MAWSCLLQQPKKTQVQLSQLFKYLRQVKRNEQRRWDGGRDCSSLYFHHIPPLTYTASEMRYRLFIILYGLWIPWGKKWKQSCMNPSIWWKKRTSTVSYASRSPVFTSELQVWPCSKTSLLYGFSSSLKKPQFATSFPHILLFIALRTDWNNTTGWP